MRNSARTLSVTKTIADLFRGQHRALASKRPAATSWLALPVSVVLSLPLAYLIVNEAWHIALALVLLVPMSILLSRYPFAAVIAWLLVSPFFASTDNEAGRQVYWLVHRAMIPVGLGIVTLSRALKIKDYRPARLGPAEAAMGVFAGLVAFSILLLQQDIERSFVKYYDRILVPYFMYLLVRLAAPREKDLRRLLAAAVMIALGQSVIGLLSWLAPAALPSQWLSWQGARTAGTLGNPAVYTSALVFAICLLLQAAVTRKHDLVRFTFLLAFVLGAISIFLSLSRGSWLGGLLVVGGLLLLFPKPMARIITFIAFTAAVLASTALSSQFSLAVTRLTTVNTIQSRIANTGALLAMAGAKPFFGWGYESEALYARSFIDQIGLIDNVNMVSHNTYLTILAEMGIVGLLLYLFPFAYWLIQSVRASSSIPKRGLWSRSLVFVLWLIIINHVAVSLFMDMRFFSFGLTLWWMTLGLLANVVSPYVRPGSSGVSMRQTVGGHVPPS